MSNFSFKYKKGFTLIELLVVVAIIGLLASVVMASLNNSRTKGVDSAIKSDLSSVKNQAELYYTTYSTYGGTAHAEGPCSSVATGNILADTTLRSALNHANTSSGGTISTNTYTLTRCAVSSSSYAVAVTLKNNSNKAWCVDSSSSSKETVTNASNGNTILGAGTTADPYRCGS